MRQNPELVASRAIVSRGKAPPPRAPGQGVLVPSGFVQSWLIRLGEHPEINPLACVAEIFRCNGSGATFAEIIEKGFSRNCDSVGQGPVQDEVLRFRRSQEMVPIDNNRVGFAVNRLGDDSASG